MPEETAILQDASKSPLIEDAAVICAKIARYRRLRECQKAAGETNWMKVAEKLGWTLQSLRTFLRSNMGLVEYAEQISMQSAEEQVRVPTEGEMMIGLPGAPPTPEEIAQAVAKSDEALLQGGLESLGLTKDEAQEAMALQKFNRQHFLESMDMISAGVLRTSLRAQMEQKEIQKRLGFVRDIIATYGEFHSEELGEWEKKERLLMRQFTDVGTLLNQIQDTWYKGAAALAVIKMRARESSEHRTGFRTQRSNKPGFRPVVIEESKDDEAANSE